MGRGATLTAALIPVGGGFSVAARGLGAGRFAPAIGGGTAGGLGSFPMNEFSPRPGQFGLGALTGAGGGTFGAAVGGPISFGANSSRQAVGVLARGGVGVGSNAIVSTIGRKDGC